MFPVIFAILNEMDNLKSDEKFTHRNKTFYSIVIYDLLLICYRSLKQQVPDLKFILIDSDVRSWHATGPKCEPLG